MCKNRIFSPSIVILLAASFCFTAVRIEQAAQQEPQPGKSSNKTSDHTSGATSGAQSPGGGSPEQKQESKPTPTPAAPGKQTPLGQIQSQLGEGGAQQDGPIKLNTELVSLPVT